MTLAPFLADTWWYALSSRMSPELFERAAALRASQGFDAVQLVAGVPPEIAPEHPAAQGPAGFPWTLDRRLNPAYVRAARERITQLNDHGLTAIVYGAWGHQVRLLGVPIMCDWWSLLIETLDDLDVIWCLTGEADIWIEEEQLLLPAGSTDHPTRGRRRAGLPNWCSGTLARINFATHRARYRGRLERRRAEWNTVLESVAPLTRRPLLMHTSPDIFGDFMVRRPGLLAANTIQTGHDEATRDEIWRKPRELIAADPLRRGVINLEPWYEGIRERFGPEDQLYAYWASMTAGCRAACYGAHGLWNAGDGSFLTHWGPQTAEQALALETPRLLGLSHRMFLKWVGVGEAGTVNFDGETLISQEVRGPRGVATFIPDLAKAPQMPAGDVWRPLEGRFVDVAPARGQAVIVATRSP